MEEDLLSIAENQMNQGDFAAALETAGRITDSSRRAWSLREIAEVQAKTGEFNAALETASRIESEIHRVETLREIAVTRAWAGDLLGAKATFDFAIEATQKMWITDDLQEFMLELIAFAQARVGDEGGLCQTLRLTKRGLTKEYAVAIRTLLVPENADLQVLRRIEDEESRTWVLIALAIHWARTRKFVTALQMAEWIDSEVGRSTALREIATLQAQDGQVTAAQETAEKITSELFKAIALGAIARTQARAGDVANALQIADRISLSKVRAMTQRQIATLQLQIGHFDDALRTARRIDDEREKAAALGKISIALAEVKNISEINDWPRRAEVLATVAEMLMRTDAESAKTTLASAAEAADRIEVEYLRNEMRARIAKVQAVCEELEFQGSSAKVPVDRIDRVYFSVTSMPSVVPSTAFVVNVWAHLDNQVAAVIRRAREAASGERSLVPPEVPFRVLRGDVLTVRLTIRGFRITDRESTILWEGEIGKASFPVRVPRKAKEGTRSGFALIYLDGVQLGKIHFTLSVGKKPSEVAALPIREERHQNAFASYASGDRDQVLARLQGIQKAAPQLKIFCDVLSLRSGQYWEQELWRVIPSSDVFYLFWSKKAKDSKWVEKEWRCALETKGLDFIDPVPLVSPDEVPPPPELASKHFNDWVLAFMRSERLQA